MTENDHRLQCAGCALFFGVQPSPLRLQSEHVEKRSGREDSDEALRLVDAGEVDALPEVHTNGVERAALAADLLVLFVGQQAARKAHRAPPNRHQSIRMRIRQGPQQHGIDDAEHGGVGADADGKREDRDKRERRPARPQSERIANVLSQRVEHRWLSRNSEFRILNSEFFSLLSRPPFWRCGACGSFRAPAFCSDTLSIRRCRRGCARISPLQSADDRGSRASRRTGSSS